MIEGGEDPQFIARRLVISAAEDIGLANPNALLLANAEFDAVMKIGWPDGRIPLAEATVYLATSPKSNSSYLAIKAAQDEVRRSGNQPVPLPIRNAPTKLMADLGYHDGYKYPHDYPEAFTPQQYRPTSLPARGSGMPTTRLLRRNSISICSSVGTTATRSERSIPMNEGGRCNKEDELKKEEMTKIVVLDGYAANPGDLSWSH
jgi:replication-associated recombination protein RarA